MSNRNPTLTTRQVARLLDYRSPSSIANIEKRDPTFPRSVRLSERRRVYERAAVEAWAADRGLDVTKNGMARTCENVTAMKRRQVHAQNVQMLGPGLDPTQLFAKLKITPNQMIAASQYLDFPAAYYRRDADGRRGWFWSVTQVDNYLATFGGLDQFREAAAAKVADVLARSAVIRAQRAARIAARAAAADSSTN